MAADPTLLFIPTILAALLFAGVMGTLESVPDLEKVMYRSLKSYPCVRLLNLSGEIGCANPGNDKVIAPLARLNNSNDDLEQLSAVLIPLKEMENFFIRVSKDPNFAKKVAGVLVQSEGYANKPLGLSPVAKFPQAEFAPYSKLDYKWNPTGSGIMFKHYNFPVFLVSEETEETLQEMAIKNEEKQNSYPVNVAEFDLVMQTTRMETHDSESCLSQQSCLPLGGFSVWSSLPPINISSIQPPKPVVLIVASQDSASFFRDQSLGADSPISGLITLLGVVDALSHVSNFNEFKKQLVFVVLTGEAWGYLGSRKFLEELELGADTVSGLNISMIEQIVEIGSVGKGLSEGDTTFYVHAAGDSAGSGKMVRTFQSASDSLGSDNVKIKKADASNPGIPPSSMMVFSKKNSSISGVVLEDFDSSFTNKFYHSHLDDLSNINSSSIAAAVALVARALYIYAAGGSTLNLMAINSISVNVSLVEELVGCFLSCEPGLSCAIVNKFISPTTTCPNHYVGVFLDSPSSTQYPQYADDTSRFVWNFLADRTSILKGNTSSCTGQCSNTEEVCVGSELEGNGRCVISTTRYVPAYSTRLKFEGDLWHIMPANLSDPLASVDPVWTESFWGSLGVRVYTMQSVAYDRLVLATGLSLTVCSYIVIIASRAYLVKLVKRD